ncbi:MAG: 2-amino-4-hydroxy-6-hydroxymethyldihydropteridine diphosphokinase [Bacteroidales bacterium]|nr:2-amino-4-hydroxy-6-hydroxymethyldihydropteridine diphosphokinase [Bacteroidales bacterium]
MEEVIFSLGSNMGDRAANLARALQLLDESGLMRVAVSRVYETEPWGFSAGTSFYNMAAVYRTSLEPSEVLAIIGVIETSLGRIRSNRAAGYESRIIDIDILFYGDRVINEEGLIVPHRRMAERRFVLEPLNDIVPGKIHPLVGSSVEVLLSECKDTGTVKRVS